MVPNESKSLMNISVSSLRGEEPIVFTIVALTINSLSFKKLTNSLKYFVIYLPAPVYFLQLIKPFLV